MNNKIGKYGYNLAIEKFMSDEEVMNYLINESMKKEKVFTEKDLVSFGNYVLSEQRMNNIQNKEAVNYVGDWDLSNWYEYRNNN